MTGLHVTWFRQDLRVHDHAALRAACQAAAREGGQVMALYILPKPTGLEADGETMESAFLYQALTDLRAALAQREAILHLRHGTVLDVLSELHTEHQILSLHAHEAEQTYPIETATEAWALRAGVQFQLYPQFHPRTSPRSHESWQTVWERFMACPRNEAPDLIPSANVGMGRWPDQHDAAPVPIDPVNPDVSSGGRKQAIQKLRSFLGTDTRAGPNAQSGQEAFRALKPHLLLGAVSPREVWQAAIGAHQHALKAGLDIRAAAIASFLQLLPSLSQNRSQSARTQGRPARAARPSGPADSGQQLSLGLGDGGQ
ncbi:MAG: deoxyribodipyrimidine photo-lyase [Pseudomonadota bacterium]